MEVLTLARVFHETAGNLLFLPMGLGALSDMLLPGWGAGAKQ